MVKIYCDVSCSLEDNLCAWAYIVYNEDSSPSVFRGSYTDTSNIRGELKVCLDSIEYGLKLYENIWVYTDYADLHELYKRNGKNIFKKSPDFDIFEKIAEYIRSGKVKIKKIKSKLNPAHKYAYWELVSLRKKN